MPVDRSDLQIIIEAVNKASKDLTQIKKDLKAMSDETEEAGKAAKKTGLESALAAVGLSDMASAVATGQIAAIALKGALDLVTKALRGLTDLIRESVGESAEFEATMKGLDSVAKAYGFNVDAVRKASERLSKDGLLAPAEAAATLKNILAGLAGVTLEQAEMLVMAMKDTAAYNRVIDDFGDAVVLTSKGLRNRNSILSDSAGVQKNLQVILQESDYTLQDLDKTSTKYAAAQALIVGYLRESVFAAGDAAEYMETYKGKLSLLKRAALDVKVAIGDAAIPAFEALKRVQLEAVVAVKVWIDEHRAQLEQMGRDLATAVLRAREAAKAIAYAFKGIAVAAGIAGAAIITVKASQIIFSTATWATFIPAIVASIAQLKLLAASAIETAALIALVHPEYLVIAGVAAAGAFVAWETDFLGMSSNIKSTWESLKNTFSADIADMGIDLGESGDDFAGWQDKINEMLEGLGESSGKAADEIEKYAHAVEKSNKAFMEQLDDLLIAHRDTYKSLEKDIREEQATFDKSIKDKKEAQVKALKDMADRHKEKTASILEDIDEERRAAKDEIDDISGEWNKLIELTKNAGEDRLSNLQAQLDKEEALGGSANQDKIDALKKMIAKEKQALKDALSDQEGERDEEIKDVTDTLEEKITKLEAELAKEEEAHKESVEEKKASYEEDVRNFTDAYDKKLGTLEEKLSEERQIRERYAEDFNRIGDKQAEDDITRLIRRHQDELEEMTYQHNKALSKLDDFNQKVGSGAQDTADKVRDAYVGAIDEVVESAQRLQPALTGAQLQPAGGLQGGTPASWLQGGQHGGIFAEPTIIGEKGYPELVLPLGEPARADNLIKSLGRGEVTQNFYITVKRESDIDLIMERAAFNMENK